MRNFLEEDFVIFKKSFSKIIIQEILSGILSLYIIENLNPPSIGISTYFPIISVQIQNRPTADFFYELAKVGLGSFGFDFFFPDM